MDASASPPTSLSTRVLDGDRRALARLLTRVENDDEVGRSALERLLSHSGNAHLIGVTGPPGGGKSTLVNELIRANRTRSRRVAVIAVDPSSPLTGGATLGDRIRMLEWHDDPDVFIRSMASRRFGGGLAQNTLAAATVFDAAGFDPILIETVGAGQDEVAIASLAHTTVLVQAPGLGDGVQTLKAGALEIGDVIVVTKADRPEANELSRDLRRLETLTWDPHREDHARWARPVVKTSSVTGDGFDELADAIARHHVWLQESGEWERRSRIIAATQLASAIQAELLARMTTPDSDDRFAELVDRVVARDITPDRAADAFLEGDQGS